MTNGLREAAGSRLRAMLSKTTSHRLSGITLGTFCGFLVHSSATAVMLVGFVNAGLMTLAQAVPPMLGANIGTTLSMQVISLKLDEYCFLAIGTGFLLQMLIPSSTIKHAGRIILGFGILFLGMKVMKESIYPYLAMFQSFLVFVDGRTLLGMLFGLAVFAGITAIIQSSSATIGMCCAMISAGAMTGLQEVYPIVFWGPISERVRPRYGGVWESILKHDAVHVLILSLT